MTFNILTFGCKVNQCESEDIRVAMEKSGFKYCEKFSESDIVIVNSCAVTSESVRKARQTIHRIKSKNSACILVLTGCVAQAEPHESGNIEDVDIIIGNSNKNEVPEIINKYLNNKARIFEVNPIFKIDKFQEEVKNYAPHRSRAFLKIEDGCNRFCSYCIIPYARGKVRSKPVEAILSDVQALAYNGYKEVVLVGINLSSYGMDINKNLADAVEAVCNVDGIERVRLSSLEPDLMSDDILIRLSKQPKLCHQFHLALQSGSDKILKDMRRKYSASEYLETVDKIKKIFPSATFTTDLMVGFPGETEKDFDNSLKIIEKVGFLKVHVFPYSVRPGTMAEKFDNHVPKSVKTERVHKVIDKSREIGEKVLKSFVGKTCSVLYETIDEDGYYEGYTKEYLPIKTRSDIDLRGRIIPTVMGKVSGDHIFCDYGLN